MRSKGIPSFTIQSALFGIYYSEIFNTQVTQVHNTKRDVWHPISFCCTPYADDVHIYIFLKSVNFEAVDFTFGKCR